MLPYLFIAIIHSSLVSVGMCIVLSKLRRSGASRRPVNNRFYRLNGPTDRGLATATSKLLCQFDRYLTLRLASNQTFSHPPLEWPKRRSTV